MSRTASDISLREVLAFYYRHRARLMLSFFMPFLLIVAASFVPAPRYEASSVLIVRLGSEFVYQPEVANNRNGPEATIPFDRDQIFKSEVAILGSDDLHAQVIDAIGPKRLYPEMMTPGPFEPIKQYIGAWLVSVGLAEPMNDEQRKHYMLAKMVKRFDRRLDIKLEKESAVITLKFEHKDAVVAVDTLQSLLNLYLEKRKQLYLEPRVEMAQTQIQATREKAAAAELALETFKRKHRLYSLTDQRAALLQDRSEVEKREATIINPALQEKKSFFNRQLDKLDGEEREYGRLEHEKQVAEDEYALAAHKLNEAVAFEDLERERSGSVRVIQPPAAPAEPRRWQWLIILAGFFLSLLSALSMAAATEFLEGGFLTPERLERKTGLPVLAVVSMRS